MIRRTIKLSTMCSGWPELSLEDLMSLSGGELTDEGVEIPRYNWKYLISDIKKNGLQRPVIVNCERWLKCKKYGYKSTPLDGHHRVKVMNLLYPGGKIDAYFDYDIWEFFKKHKDLKITKKVKLSKLDTYYYDWPIEYILERDKKRGVKPYDWQGLIEDIKENGLKKPLIINHGCWKGVQEKRMYHHSHKDLEENQLFFQSDGNRRIKVMKTLYPDGEIDVYFTNDINDFF